MSPRSVLFNNNGARRYKINSYKLFIENYGEGFQANQTLIKQMLFSFINTILLYQWK